MSIDLTKLTPTPWTLRDEGDGEYYVADSTGKVVPGLGKIFGHVAIAVAERIVLSANAFDVMMRRGWEVRFDERHKLWSVHGEYFLNIGHVSHDPFSALVESDKWYKENVDRS
jgi:hypothetical protein